MHVVEDSSADGLFAQLTTLVLGNGIPVSPRGIPTIDVGPTTCVLTNPRSRIVTAEARKINPGFMFADALSLLAGGGSDWIFGYNQRLREFTDGGRLHGEYGPRLRDWYGVDQLAAVRNRLAQDPASRRACVVLYDPARDFGDSRDIPCTVTMHFVVRDSKLTATTFMRSQDLWLGFPYDVFNFTLLQEVIASSLGLELGPYTHITSALHLYESDLAKARNGCGRLEDQMLSQYPVVWEAFDPLMKRLVSVASGEQRQIECSSHNDGWVTFELALHAYRMWKEGDADRTRQLVGMLQDPVRAVFGRFTNMVT